jgi:hypothetical protein
MKIEEKPKNQPTSIRLPAESLEHLAWIQGAIRDPHGQPISRTDAVRLALAEMAARLGWGVGPKDTETRRQGDKETAEKKKKPASRT